MPLYEYQCTECGKIEEALQKFSDAPLTTCKHCSGRLSKLISQSSFHLKGNGWYVTDYANKKSETTKNDESTTTTKSEKTDSSSEATSTKSDS